MASYLQQILEDMLSQARAESKSYRPLSNGLRIKIMSETDGFTLILGRRITYPNMKEWQTVLNHFPYTTGSVLPKVEQKGEWFLLTGKVPTPSIAQLKFG